MMRVVLLAGVLAACPAAALAAWVSDASAPYQARAPLQFILDIGKVLYLQVGTAGSVIDTVHFDLGTVVPLGAGMVMGTPMAIGTGVPISASAGSGVVRVEVRGNSGTISLSAANDGGGQGLSNGAGRFLDYQQIETLSDNAGLPAPVLTNSGGTPVSVAPTAFGGRVTRQEANWTFRLRNTVVPAPGTYRGQVVYTAAMP